MFRWVYNKQVSSQGLVSISLIQVQQLPFIRKRTRDSGRISWLIPIQHKTDISMEQFIPTCTLKQSGPLMLYSVLVRTIK
jgi:hypothetical protein